MNIIIAIFLGGGLGSVSRFGVSKLFNGVSLSGVENAPYGTLIANILSSIILAITVYGFSDKIGDSPFLRAFIVIGFCGGFSTFSTFGYETFELIKNGHLTIAILNVLINVVFVLLVFYIFRNSFS